MRLALLISLLLAPMLAHAEPVTTAVAVFAAWVGTTAATVYLVAATVVLTTGIAVYGSAQARRAERAARDAARAAMQDRMVNRIATEAPHRYIYGRCKVGSDILAMFTSGDRDQYRHLVCVHAAHECDAIEEVYVNNVAVGLRAANGDATEGRYATDPYSDVAEETHVGPTFTLNRYPRAGTVWAFAGQGPDMTEVAVTAVSGRDVTVNYTGSVTVSYVYSVPRRFDGNEDATAQVAYNPVVRVQVHLGTPTDQADAYLMSVVPDKWKSTAVLRGLCYTVVTLDLNHPEFQNGPIPVHAMIRGRKLYDPRTGNTQWSANPALVIYDYLTSPLCGVPASDLPVAQFITAANVCDETVVAGGRYTINGTVTSDQSQATVLEQMAQAMAGGIVSTTWDIYAGKYVAPVAALTQDDIVGAISITPGASDAAIYNGVKGQFISAENNHVLTDFAPYQNATYRASDGRDLYTNIDFPFTASLQRVHNIARIFTEDQRNGFTVKAEFSLKAWPLKIGQRITFTSAFFGQSGKVYRITDRSYSPNSAVELTLKEDDPSIWDFADATVADSTPNTNLPDPWAIAPLASLSCTSGEATLLRQADGTMVPRILVTWPAAATQAVFTNGQIEVEWRAVSTAAWSRVQVSGSDTQAYLAPITPGFFYTVRARCMNPYLNTRSDWITVVYQVKVFAARPVAFKWAASKPAKPTGASSYNWGAQAYSVPAGWSFPAPAAPQAGGMSLWEAGVPVSDISIGAATAFDWADAELAAIEYAPIPGLDTVDVAFLRWAFKNTQDGWLGGSSTVTVQGDSILWSPTAANAYLSIALSSSQQFSGATYGKVRARVRRVAGSGTWEGNMFYTTAGHNSSTAYVKGIPQPSNLSQWNILEWDMNDLTAGGTDWRDNTILGLRMDLVSSGNDGTVFEVDWIAVGKFTSGVSPAVVQTAQLSADAANAAIANITSDNVLSKAEKSSVILDWTSIAGEKTRLDGQADALFVSRTAYDSAYSTLNSYLAELAPAWNDTTLDTPIDGPTFRTKFSDYYNVRQDLMNALAAKAATLANDDYSIRTPVGGKYNSNTSSLSGAIKVRLPQSWTSTMMRFTVDIYEYAAGYSCTLEIAGYNYSSGAEWRNVSARVIGGSNVEYPVRFGHDGTKCCVWIGEATETWAYPQIQVRDFFGGFSNFTRDKWEAGWQVSFDTTSAQNVTASVLDTYPAADWAKIPAKNGRPADNATSGAPAGTLVAGVAATAVATATTNFNAANDRKGTAVVAPGVASDGTAVDHTLRTDGSADISFEWSWGGDEGDIDGFLVHVYQANSSASYSFGTTPYAETVYTVPASKRAFILFGAAANVYTTFGVQAYRSVDKDIAPSGAIKSVLAKPSLAAENPYRPSSNVAWGGDVTGTVNGIPASNVNIWQYISGSDKPDNGATAGGALVTSDFSAGLGNWTNGFTGAPSSLATVTAATLITNDADFGVCCETSALDVDGERIMPKGAFAVVPGRVYRLTTVFKCTSVPDGSVSWENLIVNLDDAYSNTLGSTARDTKAVTSANVVTTITSYMSTRTLSNGYTFPAGTKYARAGFRIASTEASAPTVRIKCMKLEDVTEAYDAQQAADAANGALNGKPTVSITVPSGANYPNGSTSFGAFTANITGNGPFVCSWALEQLDSTPSPMKLDASTGTSVGLSGPGLTNAACLVRASVTVTDKNGLTATASASKNVIWGTAP